MCTNTLGVSSHHNEEDDDDDILIFLLTKSLQLRSIFAADSPVTINQTTFCGFLRDGDFFYRKKCAEEVDPGVVLRLKLFFLLGSATRFFLRGGACLFPFFFAKIRQPSVFRKLSFFSHFFLVLKTEVTETNRRCFLQTGNFLCLPSSLVFCMWREKSVFVFVA